MAGHFSAAGDDKIDWITARADFERAGSYHAAAKIADAAKPVKIGREVGTDIIVARFVVVMVRMKLFVWKERREAEWRSADWQDAVQLGD